MRCYAAVGIALVACGRLGFDASPPLDGATDARIDATKAVDGLFPVAPAFVQYADMTTGSASMLAVAYPEPVTAGDLLVVTVAYEATPLPDLATITDTSNDTFTILTPVDGTSDTSSYVSYATATSSTASETVFVALTLSAYIVVRVHEYANVDPAQPIDTFVYDTGSSSGTDSMILTIATAAPDELVFAYAVSTAGTATAGTGFTPRSTTSGDTTEDRVEPMAGDQTVTASNTGTPWTLQALAIRGF